MRFDRKKLFAMFDAVEGIGFCERSNAAGGVTSPEYVLAWIEQFTDAGIEPAPGVIYGKGGWNRYFAYDDGTVKFSTNHACYPAKLTIAKAVAAGFELY